MKKKMILAIGIIALFIGMALVPGEASSLSASEKERPKDDELIIESGSIEGYVKTPKWYSAIGGESVISGASVKIVYIRVVHVPSETIATEDDGSYSFDIGGFWPYGWCYIEVTHPDYLTSFRSRGYVLITKNKPNKCRDFILTPILLK